MTFTWLHISDLHCESGTKYDRELSLRSLMSLVQSLEPPFSRLDAIFFTGDVANKGKPDEYAIAADALEALVTGTGVSQDRVFLIPGNHDVDRDAIKKLHALNLPFSEPNSDQLDEFFEDPIVLELLDQKFSAFRECLPAGYSQWTGGRDPALVRIVPCGSGADLVRIGLIGLNSARLVSRDENDRGKLVVGRTVLGRALDKIKEGREPDAVFVLVHHPLDWLHPHDSKSLRDLLLDEAHFVLFGHMHQTEFTEIQRMAPGKRKTLFMRAGVLYEANSRTNHRQMATLGSWNPKSGEIEIRAFHRPMRGAIWHPDPLAFGSSNSDGIGKFSGPVVEFDKHVGPRVTDAELVSSPLRGDYGNKAGAVACVSLRASVETLKKIREVRYATTRTNGSLGSWTNRDLSTGFGQTLRVSGATSVSATVIFNDLSEKEIAPLSLQAPIHRYPPFPVPTVPSDPS